MPIKTSLGKHNMSTSLFGIANLIETLGLALFRRSKLLGTAGEAESRIGSLFLLSLNRESKQFVLIWKSIKISTNR